MGRGFGSGVPSFDGGVVSPSLVFSYSILFFSYSNSFYTHQNNNINSLRIIICLTLSIVGNILISQAIAVNYIVSIAQIFERRFFWRSQKTFATIFFRIKILLSNANNKIFFLSFVNRTINVRFFDNERRQTTFIYIDDFYLFDVFRIRTKCVIYQKKFHLFYFISNLFRFVDNFFLFDKS